MTPEQAVLFDVIRTLERLGVPHMVTGSVASSYHGRPRSTHDADIVIDPTRDQLDALVRSLLDAGFYVDDERARDALRRRLQFNVIQDAAGVLAVNPGVDRAYVERWARELGVLDLWREIAGEEPASD